MMQGVLWICLVDVAIKNLAVISKICVATGGSEARKKIARNFLPSESLSLSLQIGLCDIGN